MDRSITHSSMSSTKMDLKRFNDLFLRVIELIFPMLAFVVAIAGGFGIRRCLSMKSSDCAAIATILTALALFVIGVSVFAYCSESERVEIASFGVEDRRKRLLPDCIPRRLRREGQEPRTWAIPSRAPPSRSSWHPEPKNPRVGYPIHLLHFEINIYEPLN